jgi:DNA repair protein RecO (recombination protein O)
MITCPDTILLKAWHRIESVAQVYLHRAEAIVLKYTEYHETSKIVTFLTRDHGKLAGLVKGAKRPKSRFGSSLEPITHLEVMYYAKEGRSLNNITQTDVIESFDAVKRDFDRLAYGGYIVELCNGFVQEGEEPSEIFSLVLDTLHTLSDWTGDLALLASGFALRFLALTGFAPSLDRCTRCGNRVSERTKIRFSPGEGGVLCSECLEPDAVEIGAYHLRLMRNLSRIPLRRMEKAAVNKEVLRETFDLINRYTSRRGEMQLRSPAFLKATAVL